MMLVVVWPVSQLSFPGERIQILEKSIEIGFDLIPDTKDRLGELLQSLPVQSKSVQIAIQVAEPEKGQQ